jgi:hypothetical protein
MFTAAFVLLVFGLALVVFLLAQSDADSLSSGVEMGRLCSHVASHISAVSAGGDGTKIAFSLPSSSLVASYAAYVSGPARGVSIISGGRVALCPIPTSDVSNGTAASFYLPQESVMQNVGGGVVIG